MNHSRILAVLCGVALLAVLATPANAAAVPITWGEYYGEANAYAFARFMDPPCNHDEDEEHYSGMNIFDLAGVDAIAYVEQDQEYLEAQMYVITWAGTGEYDSTEFQEHNADDAWIWSLFDGIQDGTGCGYCESWGDCSLSGTLEVGTSDEFPAGSSITVIVSAQIMENEGEAYWWANLWDEDPNNPLAMLSDYEMTAEIDVRAGDTLNVDFGHGTESISGRNLIDIGFSSVEGPEIIPEPGTMLLLVPALLGIAGVLRRRIENH